MMSNYKIVLLCFICALNESNASCPTIISRGQWEAAPPRRAQVFSMPSVPYVVLHHSDTHGCNTTAECKGLVKKLQDYYMSSMGPRLNDIGFNFLIGGDGNIYEGRGWRHRGAHVKTYNSRSIGICLLGTFEKETPSLRQTQALENLLKCGVQTKKIAPDYRLIAHKQANSRRSCPGRALFELIKKMPHWDSTLK